jgi:chaperone LolA
MKKLVISVLSVCSFISQAHAYSDKEFTLQEVEQYMSNLKSFSASFDQVVPGEDFAKGKLYIKRPGKFLWEYKLPDPVKIVSDGGLVYFVDETTKQVTQVPNAGILFSLLSLEEVKFNSKTLKVVNLLQNKRRINLDLIAKIDKESDVPVSVIFEKTDDDKIRLMKIISKNQLDQTIVVSLYNQNNQAQIDNDIFKVEEEF